MFYLFHGPDLVSSRQAWVDLRSEFDQQDIYIFSRNGFDLDQFAAALEGQSLFSQRKLVVLEGLPDLRKFRRLPSLVELSAPEISIALWVPKELGRSHKLVKLAKDQGRLLFFKGDSLIFSFLDNLFSGKSGETFIALERLRLEGESPVRIFASIASQVRGLLAVISQAAYIGKKHPFYLNKLRKQARRFNQGSLCQLISVLFEYDFGVKTGKMESEAALIAVVSCILDTIHSPAL